MRGWMKSLRKHRESAMCGSMTRLGPQLGASAVILGSAWQLPGSQIHPITGITIPTHFPHDSMCTTPAPLKGGWGRGTILRLKRRANGRSGVSPRGGYTPSGGTLLRQLPPRRSERPSCSACGYPPGGQFWGRCFVCVVEGDHVEKIKKRGRRPR